MKTKIIFLFLLIISFTGTFNSQTEINDQIPDRIVLNLTTEPNNSIAITWRTIGKVENPLVQIAKAGDWINFTDNVKSVNATSKKIELDSNKYFYSHSVILKGLSSNCLYAYRVGGDSVWSEWNQFTTSKKEYAPFSFVFFGDPQNGVKDFVTRVFREALLKEPNAKFWLFIGDLLENTQYDKYWSEWFYTSGFIPSIIPSIMAPGSHEYIANVNGVIRYDQFTRFWNGSFTLPKNGIQELGGRCYYIDYQGVRFIILDSQMALEEQGNWLDKILANNPNKWTIAAMHEPIFNLASHRNDHKMRDAFMPIFDKYSVDLVLTGHDHLYGRSKKLKNGKIVNENQKGTIYVVSVCGSKAYKLSSRYNDIMQKTGEKLQLFQVISFKGNKLLYKSYTATGKLFDSLELMKN